MALINFENSNRVDKERNTIHREVKSSYTSFTDESGGKYFQIDTYGSSNRKIYGKISQSFQLDKKAAIELVNILKREFDI